MVHCSSQNTETHIKREEREKIQKEWCCKFAILPKRETLCLTKADILQKILQSERKEKEEEENSRRNQKLIKGET